MASKPYAVVRFPKDYVYAHPPPENAYLLKYYTSCSLRRRRCQSFRRCLHVCLVLLLLLAVAATVVHIVLSPRAPRFSVAALSFERFDPGRAFSPSIRADLRVENPNRRVRFAYRSGGSVEVYQRGARLCGGEWPAFKQGRGEATVVPVAMSGPEMRLGKEAEGEWRTGNVAVEVEIRVPAAVEAQGRVWWTARVRAKCDVSVGNATRVMTAQSCGVHVKWF